MAIERHVSLLWKNIPGERMQPRPVHGIWPAWYDAVIAFRPQFIHFYDTNDHLGIIFSQFYWEQKEFDGFTYSMETALKHSQTLHYVKYIILIPRVFRVKTRLSFDTILNPKIYKTIDQEKGRGEPFRQDSSQDFIGGKVIAECTTYLKCLAQFAYILSCHNESLCFMDFAHVHSSAVGAPRFLCKFAPKDFHCFFQHEPKFGWSISVRLILILEEGFGSHVYWGFLIGYVSTGVAVPF